MKKTYSPREFGRLVNRTTQTLQRWDRNGTLVAGRTITNRRFYTHDDYLAIIGQVGRGKVISYCRVLSGKQRVFLVAQRLAIDEYCTTHNKSLDHKIEDIGSGLNYRRKGFLLLLEMVEQGEVAEILITHRESFVRFGYEWFFAHCERHGTVVTIIESDLDHPSEEIETDIMTILNQFSPRLYGLRRYKKKIKELLTARES